MQIVKPVVILVVLAFVGGFVLSPDSFDAMLPLASGSWQNLSKGIRGYQKLFSKEVTEAVRAVADEGLGSLAIWNMFFISFFYGVFHAVGPGHGKMVVSSYSLTHEVLMRKTIAIAMASSLTQGLVAIFLVGFAWLALDGGARSFGFDAEKALEPISYSGFILIGLWLVSRGLRTKGSSCCRDGHVHGHDIADGDTQASQGVESGQVATSAIKKKLARGFSVKETFLMILAIGIRPCSGALLVLVLAFLMGQWAAGLASVIAMSTGTGLTVSAIALSARGIRVPILKLVESVGVNQFLLGRLIPILGGVVIGAFGSLLVYEYVTRPIHPFV